MDVACAVADGGAGRGGDDGAEQRETQHPGRFSDDKLGRIAVAVITDPKPSTGDLYVRKVSLLGTLGPSFTTVKWSGVRRAGLAQPRGPTTDFSWAGA